MARTTSCSVASDHCALGDCCCSGGRSCYVHEPDRAGRELSGWPAAEHDARMISNAIKNRRQTIGRALRGARRNLIKTES